MAGEQRRNVALYRLDFVRRVGARQHEEDIGDPLKLPPALLQRRDRIVEARLGRVCGNRVDLGPVLRQRPVEGRAEVLGLDRGEWRQLEFAGPGGEQRVLDVWGGCGLIRSI